MPPPPPERALREDPTKRREEYPTTGSTKLRQFPGLSIEWHPDIARIGDIALLDLDPGGRELPISRKTPVFSRRRDGRETGGVLDDHFSATEPAFHLRASRDGAIEIRPGTLKVRIKVEDEILGGPRLLSKSELSRGVVIVVAQRTVFLLREVRFQVRRSPDLGLVGGSDELERVREEILKVARFDRKDVFIRGETGVGKEEIARAVHAQSPRAHRRYEKINMASLTPSTAVSELFGHERGAFTGATDRRDGWFVVADGGTLFLDEIGATPPEVQKMLLRVLETREVTPLGARQTRRVNVRILFATNAKLEDPSAAGGFAADLFHRLGDFTITIPPLRERLSDIGPLLVHFLEQDLEAAGQSERRARLGEWLPGNIVARALLQAWPGNVRDLRRFAREVFARYSDFEQVSVDEWLRSRLAAHPSPEAGSFASEPGSGKLPDREELRRAYEECGRSPARLAEKFGMASKTAYALIRDNPWLGMVAGDIPTDDLMGEFRRLGGDVRALADHFRTSERALKSRLRDEGALDPPSKPKS